MSEEVLAHACEPFYTTKEPGKGSGLGLAQVYGLARQSRGGLRIKSAAGQGYDSRGISATQLRAGGGVTRGYGTANIPRLFGSRATVLVVDDQEDVREVTVAHLEALGYQVIQAASGRTALDLLGGTCAGIELVMADYACRGCPGSSWPGQCAPRARSAGHHCHRLCGYHRLRRSAPKPPVLLKKPYRMNELGATVEYALQRRGCRRKLSSVVRPRLRRRDADGAPSLCLSGLADNLSAAQGAAGAHPGLILEPLRHVAGSPISPPSSVRWPTDPKMEALREAWFDAPDVEAQTEDLPRHYAAEPWAATCVGRLTGVSMDASVAKAAFIRSTSMSDISSKLIRNCAPSH